MPDPTKPIDPKPFTPPAPAAPRPTPAAPAPVPVAPAVAPAPAAPEPAPATPPLHGATPAPAPNPNAIVAPVPEAKKGEKKYRILAPCTPSGFGPGQVIPRSGFAPKADVDDAAREKGTDAAIERLIGLGAIAEET